MSIASEFQIMDVTSPAAAAELGRRLGAGSVLRGALVGDGITVRLDLGLFDTEGLAPLAQGITLSGHRDSLGVLTDSIVWALQRQIWRAAPCGPAMAAWCFTRSTPATSRVRRDPRFQCLLRRIGFPDSLTVRPPEGCRGEDG
jgi:hypothetical protein